MASGQYEQGWWESMAVGFTSALLPSSDPSTKITFDDGTVLIVLGGGPDSGALAGQAAFFLGVRGAAVGAATLRQAVVSAFKHLGRESAEHIADNVVQEVTGLPVGPTGLLPRKGKSPKARGGSRPSKPRQTKKAQPESAHEANPEGVKQDQAPNTPRLRVPTFWTKIERAINPILPAPCGELWPINAGWHTLWVNMDYPGTPLMKRLGHVRNRSVRGLQ